MRHLKAESVIQTYNNPERNNNKQTEQTNVDRTDVPKWNKLNALVNVISMGKNTFVNFQFWNIYFG